MTPFSTIISELQSHSWEYKGNKEVMLISCVGQLIFLETLYFSMKEFDLRIYMRPEGPEQLKDKRATYKAVLDYFSFLNILNQFGRVLKRYDIDLPFYRRVKFFRNKVLEHWDEYTGYVSHGSISQTFGKPAIPCISGTYNPDQRKTLYSEICKAFTNLGIEWSTINPEALNISNNEDYINTTYNALEKIDPFLTAKTKDQKRYLIPDDLVKLLLEFGFPVPIIDVEKYSEDLVRLLSAKLKPLILKSELQ